MERAQLASQNLAAVIFGFLATIVAAGLVFVFLQQAWQPLIEMASNNADRADTSTGITYAKRGWGRILLVVLAMALAGGIAGAASIRVVSR